MACKKDVEEVIYNVVNRDIKNITKLNKEGFAEVTKDFGKTDFENIKILNDKFKERVINHIKSTDNDLPGTIQIKISEPLYEQYIRIIEKVQLKKATEEAKQLELEDTSRADMGENPSYLFESKKNLNDLVSRTTTDKFGKTKIETPEEIRYEYSEEIKNTIFAGEPRNITAKEALSNILNTGIFDKNSKEFEQIHRMIISTKATIKLVDSKDMKSTDTYMQYNTVDNTIEMSVDNLGDVSSVKEGVEKFLHEVYHDRTLRVLRTPKNATEQKLRNDLKKVYDGLKPLLEDKYPHEMSSLEEFTAGMFSNKQFEFEVEQLINAKKSFWDVLTAFFRDLFGLDNSYNKLINNLLRLIDTTDENYTGIDTLEAKYTYGQKKLVAKKGLQSITISIEKTFSDLEVIANRSQMQDSPFLTKLKTVKNEIDVLLDKYVKDSDEYRLESIKIFNKFMEEQLNSSNKILANVDITSQQYENVKVYNNTFKSLQIHIDNAVEDLETNNIITAEEHVKLNQEIEALISNSKIIDKKLLKVAKKLNRKSAIFQEQYKDVLLKYEQKFRQEGKAKGLTKATLDEYVNKQLSENRELIQKETDETWFDLIDSPLTDITSLSATVNSEKDFTHPIIRVFSRILDKVKHEYTNLIQPKLLELQEATNIFLDGSRIKSSDENYKNLFEWSKNDEGFLLGEYQIGFRDSFNELMNTVNAEDFGKDLSDEDKLKLKKSKMRNWFKLNTDSIKNFDEDGNPYYITKPAKQWKTDFSKLTQKERDYLAVLQSQAKEANDNYGISVKSLKKNTLGVDFYQLPSHHKETITHLKNLNKDIFKELWQDTFKLRTDDTTQGEQDFVDDKNVHIVRRDLSGKEVDYIPIHFRGKIPKSKQSTDLATMYAMEIQQSIKFKSKTKVHTDLKIFIDIIQENGFIKKQGLGSRVVSYFNNDGTTSPVIVDKQDAHLIKMLETMMNNRLYDKTSTYLGKIGNADGAKIESFIRGVVSRTSQAINFVGAPANAIGGKVQSILEVISDPNLSVKNIKNAEIFFFKHLGNTIDDVGRNIYKSLPNQLLMSFGGLVTSDLIQNNFEKNKALALTNTKPLFFMQEGGEHWIQSIHTMTILDGAKILDEKGNYLDKNGNVTTKENAASILDISVLENGKLTTSIKTPFYTTIDRMTEYNKGGNSTLRSYIQSSLIKSQGQYSTEYQSELQRHTLGKAVAHFKKHIISPGLRRFRGLGTNAFSKPEDVILNFESDLLRPDEGNYVTWLRFLTRSVAPKLAKLQFSLIVKDFNEMDEWEKGNIVRTFTELAYIMVMANLALLAAGAASDDDDNDVFWYIAAITRRNQSDAQQFIDPREAWRVLKNPISSLKFIESSTDVIAALSNYVNPLAEDRNEKITKASSKMIKYLIPGYGHLLDTTPKEQYGWSNR
jgi:hypothetical protein